MIEKSEALKLFPAREFRKYQKETIEKMVDALNSGYRVILLDSPTGSGKSIVNTVFARLFWSFYVTPQLTLMDQILADKNIGRYYTEIKGRENYTCVKDIFLPTVRDGLCRRDKSFRCNKWSDCPYYSQKMRAMNSNTALMSFAYFILEGQIPEDADTPRFGNRDLVIMDESHSIDRYAIDHSNVDFSPFKLPFDLYEQLERGVAVCNGMKDVKELVEIGKEMAEAELSRQQLTLEGEVLKVEDVRKQDKLKDFMKRAEIYLKSVEEDEWVYQVGWVTYRDKRLRRLLAQPVSARNLMKDMVWNRGDLFIVSSATILSSEMFIHETGLDKKFKKSEVYHLKVASTFPPQNRPIIDLSVGRMRKDEREQNLPILVQMLENIIEHENKEKLKNIAVHCHAYSIAESITKLVHPKYKSLLISHTSENREEMLEKWKNSKGNVFLAVGFTEGQDWRDELCEVQVIAKMPYPDIADRRVARRLERGAYNWYGLECLKNLIQAYGRAVRSPTEVKPCYILDGSFGWLIRRSWKFLPDWFRAALPSDCKPKYVLEKEAKVK